jgi:hypothetical protein
MEQASRHHLVQHKKTYQANMVQARTKQTVEFRHSCKEIQKEYKRKITEKYSTLENESMQIADQAVIDLGDILQQVLQQEKNNILHKIKPDIILAGINQDITATLEIEVSKHMDAIKEQRKTVITQIQKTAKRTVE